MFHMVQIYDEQGPRSTGVYEANIMKCFNVRVIILSKSLFCPCVATQIKYGVRRGGVSTIHWSNFI